MMSLSTFLMIEPTGQRAERALGVLGRLLGSNVEKTGRNNITISIPSELVDSTVQKEDDFRSTEVTLSMFSAFELDKKSKKNVAEKLKEKISMFVHVATESEKEKKRTGFFTTFYFPFFKKLKADNKLETAAYIMNSSSDEKDIKKWMSKNVGSVNEFYEWLKNYEWSGKQ